MQQPSLIATQAGHQTVTIALLFAAYLGTFGVFIPFFPIWLGAQGLSPTWIAVLVATPLMVRVVTTSFVADVAERYNDPRAPMRFLSVSTVVLFATVPFSLLIWPPGGLAQWPAILLCVVAVMAIGWNALLPLSDALAIQNSRQTGADYGRVRVWGSVAFIATSFAAGSLVDLFSDIVIPWLIVASFSALWVACLILPPSFASKVDPTAGLSGKVGPTEKASGWRFLREREGATTVFIGSALMQASHAVIYGFGSLAWSTQGISDVAIGLLWSVGVLCEIVLFAVSAPIIARLGARGLLIVGGFGAMVRWSLLALAPNLAITFGLQVLHAFSFGMTHLAMISYVQKRAKTHELRAAQGVYGLVSGAIMAIATLAAGPLYQTFGFGAYWAMAALCAAGWLVVLVDRVRRPRPTSSTP